MQAVKQAPITESPCPTNNQVNILVVHPFEEDESLLSSSKTSLRALLAAFKAAAIHNLLKWVNTEWKQVEADWHELQSMPNF